MLFHLNCRITWIALVISGATGIAMAYYGYGVWSLITQQLLVAFVTGVMLWLQVKWRPMIVFDFSRLKSLFNFGWKIFLAGLLDVMYRDIYELLIGKLFSLKILAYYNNGRQFHTLGIGVINSTIGSVLLPTFTRLQDDPQYMRSLAQKGLKTKVFCNTYSGNGFCVLASP